MQIRNEGADPTPMTEVCTISQIFYRRSADDADKEGLKTADFMYESGMIDEALM